MAESRSPGPLAVELDDGRIGVPVPFPSPADWRDVWIYFLMVDRFNNPTAPPRAEWDTVHAGFQGGTFDGVRAQLDYLERLGVGALWLAPVQKNCQWDTGTYHGYGIQDFLAIEPRFASGVQAAQPDSSLAERELRQLVDEAHARGIYVIFDIVLNHAGDVFAYDGVDSPAPWRDDPPYKIRWRDQHGLPQLDAADLPVHPDAAVHPEELRRDELFRRRGTRFASPSDLTVLDGDFFHLKQLDTNHHEDGSFPVRDLLIRVYQYLIARFDVDGYRIDTLGYVAPAFAREFGRSMREFAQSIGKRNFFTFGEVVAGEEKIVRFVGRPAAADGEPMGVDAALDFPVFGKLPDVVKGFAPPADLVQVFEHRRRVHREVIGAHGEPGSFFVTFLDNHDQHRRFSCVEPSDRGRFADQVTMALGCIFCLQGIPCVYYGTEQGLCGTGESFEAVREALWGKPDAFDLSHPVAQTCRALTDLRTAQPALRYGRQYFRPLSGNGTDFGISHDPGGVLAFSRLLSDLEVVVVANTNPQSSWSGEVMVDRSLNPVGSQYSVAFSNLTGPAPTPGPVGERKGGSVRVEEVDGTTTDGPVRALPVTARPMEIQVLAPY